MSYSVNTIGCVALLLVVSASHVVAQNRERVDALRDFIEANSSSPSVVEAEGFLQALIVLDDKYATQKLASTPSEKRLQVMQQLIEEVPYTPTAERLKNELKELDEKKAIDELQVLKERIAALPPQEAILKLRKFMELYANVKPVEEEARSLLADLQVTMVAIAWEKLRAQLGLETPEILRTKNSVDEGHAMRLYEYGSRLMYGREKHLTNLIQDYPNTAAAGEAKKFLRREQEQKREQVEHLAQVREYWDARIPSRTKAQREPKDR